MPELPEVETIARDLRRSLAGATVRRVVLHRADIVRPPGRRGARVGGTPSEALRRLVGRTARTVERRGKWLLIDFDGATLLIHLGMSGQVFVAHPGKPPAAHTHLVLHLGDGRTLRFRDPRRFGRLCVAFNGERPACLENLGPEPLQLDPDGLAAILSRHNRRMKPLLTDQRVIAGIGNIYADEILFRSRVHPLTLSPTLGRRRARAVCLAMQDTLTEAIDHNGTTINDYVTGTGVPGAFQRRLRVYGRAGKPCARRRCGGRIVRIVVAQRGTYLCPNCQRLRRRKRDRVP